MAEKDDVTDEGIIRGIIEARVRAVGEKDIDALMAHHARKVLTFDVLDPLRNSGAEVVRRRAEKWLSSYDGAPGYEVRDLSVTAGETVTFCHYVYRVSGKLKEGGEVDMWVRATICFVKEGGEWKIMHEHQSVPFDARTGKASLDLRP